MEYFVADTYKDYKLIGEPYANKSGKLASMAECTCPRCNGLGIIVARVENDRMIPIPVDGGVCYQCGGRKIIQKEIRLYTKAEYDSMQRNKERAAERRQKEQEKRMQEEFEENKRKWIADNGFSEDGKTAIITGETYSIKDDLKAKGYKYDSVLRWHKDAGSALQDVEYSDRSVIVNLDDVIEINAWGKGHYKTGALEYINKVCAGTPSNSTSDWIAAPGDTIKNLKVQLVSKSSFNGKYGLTNIINFIDEKGNKLSWFTTTTPIFKINDWVKISTATVKKNDEYKGEKITTITRPKLEEVNNGDIES